VSGWEGEVRAALGPVVLIDRSAPLGQATVYEAIGPGGTVAWVKRHRSAAGAAREVAAYTRWVPAVGWGFAPLLGVVEGGRTLLLGPVVGVPLAEVPRREPALEALGRLLRALHGVPVGEADPVPLGEALARRAQAWADAGGAPDAWRRGVLEAVAEVPEVPRAPCHRDVQLHNVLWTEQGVVLLDLGQARPDHPAVDLVKLLELPGDPLGRSEVEALWAGYGARTAAGALRGLRALHGLATWAWGQRHGVGEAMARGRAVLESALDGGSGPGDAEAWWGWGGGARS
jgi:8-oxo-dGTP diphosphatase